MAGWAVSLLICMLLIAFVLPTLQISISPFLFPTTFSLCKLTHGKRKNGHRPFDVTSPSDVCCRSWFPLRGFKVRKWLHSFFHHPAHVSRGKEHTVRSFWSSLSASFHLPSNGDSSIRYQNFWRRLVVREIIF